MNTQIYKIEALTNLHVGSGDANYGVIDNLVQRDPVTDLPTINGSSLKGALREFFEHLKSEKVEGENKEKEFWKDDDDKKKVINEIFGSNDKNAGYRFLSANLLAMPVRSNHKAYFLATAPMLLEQLKTDADNFGKTINLSAFEGLKPKNGEPIVFTETAGLLIEDFNSFEKKENEGNTILGDFENLIIFSDDDFKKLCNDTNLPVIARNKVGENLWYKQIVPHKSLFYFTVLHNGKNLGDFNGKLAEGIVHIGANATVGYGFTKITEL